MCLFIWWRLKYPQLGLGETRGYFPTSTKGSFNLGVVWEHGAVCSPLQESCALGLQDVMTSSEGTGESQPTSWGLDFLTCNTN